MGHSVLQVPVPELEDVVRAHSGIAVDGEVVLAHVTVLGPFLDKEAIDSSVVEQLVAFFRSVSPFEYSLATIDSFSGGPTYLAPEPAVVFRDLTTQLWELFPSCPPYGGMFAEVVPHLSLGVITLNDARQLLSSRLPVRPIASAVDLVWYEERVSLLHRFELGTDGRSKGASSKSCDNR